MSPKTPGARLGAYLARRRAERGLTQGQLAETLGMSSSEVVSRWERGEREPRLEMIEAIARALDIRAGELIDEAIGPTQLRVRVLTGGMRDGHAAVSPTVTSARRANPEPPPSASAAAAGADAPTPDPIDALLARLKAAPSAHARAACRIALQVLDELDAL